MESPDVAIAYDTGLDSDDVQDFGHPGATQFIG